MATSTIPAVISALKTLLAARGGLANVQVWDGIPTDPEAEYIWIADADGNQAMATAKGAGGPTRNEEYGISVVCRVQWPLDDPTGARNRVFALMAEVEAQLRGDATLGVLGSFSGWAQIAGPITYQPDRSSEQQISKLLFTVHVKARI
jgi:hypothetical protein